jgi:hypothetical protein
MIYSFIMTKTSERLEAWWKSPRGCFHKHKFNAKHRSVPFLFTFDEWWSVWDASGKWDQRGRGVGQYVMSRFGDIGPYSLGNVEIRLASDNTAERNRNSPTSSEAASAMGRASWANVSPEDRTRLMNERRANRVYGPHSDETRVKMKAAAKTALPKRVRNERGQWASST